MKQAKETRLVDFLSAHTLVWEKRLKSISSLPSQNPLDSTKNCLH